MIIKAMRLQAWVPAGGGARVSRHPPSKKVLWLYWGPFCYFFFIWGPFCYFFFIWGPFCYVFLIFGCFFTMWEPFCYFLLHGGAFLEACPPSLTKISAGSHDCKEASRACCPEIFCVTTI